MYSGRVLGERSEHGHAAFAYGSIFCGFDTDKGGFESADMRYLIVRGNDQYNGQYQKEESTVR